VGRRWEGRQQDRWGVGGRKRNEGGGRGMEMEEEELLWRKRNEYGGRGMRMEKK